MYFTWNDVSKLFYFKFACSILLSSSRVSWLDLLQSIKMFCYKVSCQLTMVQAPAATVNAINCTPLSNFWGANKLVVTMSFLIVNLSYLQNFHFKNSLLRHRITQTNSLCSIWIIKTDWCEHKISIPMPRLATIKIDK